MSLELKGLLAALAAGLVSLGAAFAVAAVGRSLSTTAPAQHVSAFAAPPVASSALVAVGGKFFAQSCAECHGAHGQGNDGPALQDGAYSSVQVVQAVTYGVPGGMPSFRAKYKPSDIAAISAYVETLK